MQAELLLRPAVRLGARTIPASLVGARRQWAGLAAVIPATHFALIWGVLAGRCGLEEGAEHMRVMDAAARLMDVYGTASFAARAKVYIAGYLAQNDLIYSAYQVRDASLEDWREGDDEAQ